MKNLLQEDIGSWVTYYNPFTPDEKGKIKSFDNNTKTAYIVFKCNNDYDNYKNYAAEICNYEDLEDDTYLLCNMFVTNDNFNHL